MRKLLNGFSRGLATLAVVLAILPTVLATHALAAQQPEAAPQAQGERPAGGEASLVLPDLGLVDVGGYNGRSLLFIGMFVSVAGMLFGLLILNQLKNMAVHSSMREISELIYETCKTYLVTQGKFIAILEVFIAAVIVLYFGILSGLGISRVGIILLFSVVGILGSYSVAWFGIRVNTYANSRTAFASLEGRPYPVYAIPLKAGMSIGMLLISVELLIMLFILLFIPGDYAGACFIGFAIGESLGAAALRIAGGIFTKIADIGSDLMKIVFNIKEDDARNPGVMRVMMIVASAGSYLLNEALAKARYGTAAKMNFEAPLTQLVWLTSIVSVAMTYVVSRILIPDLGDGTLWWKLSTIITCGTLAGAIIPELVKVFTSVESSHVREVVASSREGGASLNILSGLVAGNFSAYWLGLSIVALMSVAYFVSAMGPSMTNLMLAPAVFAFGLVAFGFLGMGPVTIAVDSYGPVTDNAQSVYELSLIETVPNIHQELKRDFGITAQFDKAKDLLEENDGAGNTFKATAKPVLIGTAVVGATTMIFSIIMELTLGLTQNLEKLSILHAPFLLGLVTGGSVIYWFTGASMQAVTTGAYRAVEFIKANIKLDGVTKASVADSKKVVEICTQYAQKGMFNIFLTVFFSTLAFAFVEPFFFIGYLLSIALFGLYQAVFMANAGGAWDNAKKIVETELKMKGTPLHAATVVGDTVGDPFKDTSSVALNPVIKFTTLFGLLAVSLAVRLTEDAGSGVSHMLAAGFFAISVVFVYRSFYGMRIGSGSH
jgi:K(+)-stimulated pyrophosphate-energized sodium pump